MDEPQSDRQRVLAALDLVGGKGPGLPEDTRDEWDIMEDYVESDQHSICPLCRQIETMELAIGGNGFSEYKCSFCGQQVRLEDDSD